MTAQMNTWEEQALMHTTTGYPPDPLTFDSLIYPGIYSPSGLDILTILVSIHTRPSPTIYLGAVDDSCAILISDLTLPDQPIIYASSAFTALTGYLPQEVLGRNCRFLQRRPRQPLAALPMAQQQSGRSQSGKVGVGGGGGGGSGGVKGSTKQNSSSISSSSVNGNGYDCGIDMPSVVHKMRRAVARNREVQVEVVNYKKTGEPFVNLLTIIPVWVPTAYGSSSTGSLGNGDCNLSVGFLCDLSTVGC